MPACGLLRSRSSLFHARLTADRNGGGRAVFLAEEERARIRCAQRRIRDKAGRIRHSAAHFARAVGAVPSALGQCTESAARIRDGQPGLLRTDGQLIEHPRRDLFQRLCFKRAEHNDLVQAAQKLRPQDAPCRTESVAFGKRTLPRFAEPEGTRARQLSRAEVGGQEHQCIREIRPRALRIGEAALLEDLEQ